MARLLSRSPRPAGGAMLLAAGVAPLASAQDAPTPTYMVLPMKTTQAR